MLEPGGHSREAVRPQSRHGTRMHARFRLAAQVNASQLSPAGKPEMPRGVLRGKSENISTGGMCVRTKRALKTSGLVRCGPRLPGIPVHVPFLAQVRWIEKRSGANPYRVGLQFIV